MIMAPERLTVKQYMKYKNWGHNCVFAFSVNSKWNTKLSKKKKKQWFKNQNNKLNLVIEPFWHVSKGYMSIKREVEILQR